MHCSDGTSPQAGVTFDNVGNLYGTTELGGTSRGGGAGIIYKLAPKPGGWVESVLVAFNAAQGLANPKGVVSLDAAGYLFSSAFSGGSQGLGGLFRLNVSSGILRGVSFDGDNGAQPTSGVLVDSQTGLVYGTTYGFPGTVFKVGKSGKETVLYSFCEIQNCLDGAQPYANVIMHSGHLYGTTQAGGTNGFGVVFQIAP
jgi:uncharacterized repeat protein (TIGR03803 family)